MLMLIILSGLLAGGFAGHFLARILGIATKEVEVGRVGDTPVYQYRVTLLAILFGMAGSIAGFFVSAVVAKLMGLLNDPG